MMFSTSLDEQKRKGTMWKEEGALGEAMDDWVLLKKLGQTFGRNTWKRSWMKRTNGTIWWKLI